jgi:hypothetical protein
MGIVKNKLVGLESQRRCALLSSDSVNKYTTIEDLKYWVMHPVARVSINIVYYIETSVRNKCRCSFYCALFTLHVSAPIGGHVLHLLRTEVSI